MRVRAHRDAESAREPEIRQLQRVRALVHEQVLRFQVAVQNAVRVAIRDPRAHLVHEPLHRASVVADVRMCVQVLLQVYVQKLEDEVQLLVLVNHVHQTRRVEGGLGK